VGSQAAPLSTASATAISSGTLDPARFVVRQDHLATGGTQKITTTIRVDKPASTAWVWTPANQALRQVTAVLCDKGLDQRSSSNWYLLAPEIFNQLGVGRGVRLVELVTYVDRHGNLGLWPVSIPQDDGRANTWVESARMIIDEHSETWVNVAANMTLGAYEARTPMTQLAPPPPIELTFAKILTIAFRGKVIDSMDHPLLRELRGEFGP
jgi:hypothetical protein